MSEQYDRTTDNLARMLGVVSLGLGATEIIRPGAVSRLGGVDDSGLARAVIPAFGARELLHAALLLGGRRPASRVWTRVAGDAMDLGALGRAIVVRDGRRRRRALIATAAVLGITALDVYTTVRAGRRRSRPGSARGEHAAVLETARRDDTLHAAITVDRPREEVYRFWHEFENLPRFMIHLESVETIGDGLSHWRAAGPAGTSVAWDAEVVEDRPGELIAWCAVGGSVDAGGRVRFADAPGGRGTEVRVELSYHPPGGKVGLAVAKLAGEHPEQQVRDDLRRLKQIMEVGEVVRSEGSPEGTRALRQAAQRPAQPTR
ncbi:hypothetical protein Pta02_77290 [Planobispora takensis]|uniref:Coenzyme Q-binding protein COQ10 START domain-containing protein n=2 Tax=Planobispora takensis TaxID=1367882 RepID=A0A8J3T5T8_9ACTN|nr:hypothetical protein Pta02_77290 [Planobispora takensis]